MNAQGEDVVAGVRDTRDMTELAELMPDAHGELMEILHGSSAHYGDMQDAEFTIEEGRLYLLQTRNAKRPAQAAVRFAHDAVRRGSSTARGRFSRSTPTRSTPCCPDLRSRVPLLRRAGPGGRRVSRSGRGAIVCAAEAAV